MAKSVIKLSSLLCSKSFSSIYLIKSKLDSDNTFSKSKLFILLSIILSKYFLINIVKLFILKFNLLKLIFVLNFYLLRNGILFGKFHPVDDHHILYFINENINLRQYFHILFVFS